MESVSAQCVELILHCKYSHEFLSFSNKQTSKQIRQDTQSGQYLKKKLLWQEEEGETEDFIVSNYLRESKFKELPILLIPLSL